VKDSQQKRIEIVIREEVCSRYFSDIDFEQASLCKLEISVLIQIRNLFSVKLSSLSIIATFHRIFPDKRA